MNNLKTFTQACIEALYFTDTGTDTEYPNSADLTEECLLNLEADCRSFWHRYGCYVEAEPTNPGISQAGHDFWLTRNGHGAGFWDGDWPIYGDMLTEGSKCYGEFYPDFEESP